MDHIGATSGYEVRAEQARGVIEWRSVEDIRAPSITLEIRTVFSGDETREEWGIGVSSPGTMNGLEIEMFHRALDHAIWVMDKVEKEEA